MTDKPIPAKILLTLADNNATGEELIGLSASLYRQNLIFSEPRVLRRDKNILELIVIFRDIISFKNWSKNPEIKEFWRLKFNSLLTEKLKVIKERDAIIEGIVGTSCLPYLSLSKVNIKLAQLSTIYSLQ